ncbi:hypothetical protein FB451DRAFT_1568231 [Mycena latifolia]|nr:hypothetical protein FB451DRAFT_1568231 [Mycena latifolia]
MLARLHKEQVDASLFSKIILGLGIFGLGLTIVLLVIYACAAWNPRSRKHLGRVSFRFLVYALLAHLVSFLINVSLMFSASMFFCMALNLPLVLAHRLNGQRMENFYVLGTMVVCAATNVAAYASGHLGWDNMNKTCWYHRTHPGEVLRWLLGTQTFWILLVSAGEVMAFLTIVRYLLAYEDSETYSSATSTSRMPGSTIMMFRGIIFRIGLYPLVSCLLNISTAVLDLDEMKHRNQAGLDFRLDLTDLAIYSARPLI